MFITIISLFVFVLSLSRIIFLLVLDLAYSGQTDLGNRSAVGQ